MDTGNNAEHSEVAEVVEFDDLNLQTFDHDFTRLESRNPGPQGKFDFLLAREWVISRVPWTTLQPRDTTVGSVKPFYELGIKPQLEAIRNLHYMWRMDVEVTVEVVSTFNMSGAIMVVPTHADWMMGHPDTGSTISVEVCSLVPHYICFASDQNVIRFTLPFQSQYDYARTPYVAKPSNAYNPLDHWADQWLVLLKVLHPLTTAASSGQCEIIVRARVVDHEFVLPHLDDDEEVASRMKQNHKTIRMQSVTARSARRERKDGETQEAEQVVQKGVVSDLLYSGARFASWVGDLTGFSNIGNAIAGVASALGHGAEKLGFQKPAEVSAPQLVAFDGLMDKRAGHSRGVADAFTFNLGEDNDQSVDEQLYGFSTQTNDFREYACIPGIVATGKFDASTTQGTLLGEVPIYPHMWDTTPIGAVHYTPAYVATQFCRAYTGDLQHMLVFSSSKFVTTKIAIQVGTHASGVPTLASIGDTYTKVLTLNGSGVVKFRTPFFHWRRVVDIQGSNPLIHIHMFLLSQSIQAPGETAAGIVTHFDWYSAFAPNCRFFVPFSAGTDNIHKAWPAGYAKDFQLPAANINDYMAIQCDPREEFRKLFDPFVESKMLAYDDALFPDEILHWNDVRMRPTVITNLSGQALSGSTVEFSSTGGTSLGGPPSLVRPMWQKVYARWRCTMRVILQEYDDEEEEYATQPMTMSRHVSATKGQGGSAYSINYQFDSGGNNNLSRVVEVPRWRTSNYDARTVVPTGRENYLVDNASALGLPSKYHVRTRFWQAGDSTVGFVPMGLWRPL